MVLGGIRVQSCINEQGFPESNFLLQEASHQECTQIHVWAVGWPDLSTIVASWKVMRHLSYDCEVFNYLRVFWHIKSPLE